MLNYCHDIIFIKFEQWSLFESNYNFIKVIIEHLFCPNNSLLKIEIDVISTKLVFEFDMHRL